MDANEQDRVDERRATVLLGLTKVELRRLSRLSGLGHAENIDRSEQMVFTYEELRRICLLAASSDD